MKVTYEFDPYEDRDELQTVQNANQLRSAVRIALDKCRGYLKHDDSLGEETRKLIEDIRAAIREELDDGFDP